MHGSIDDARRDCVDLSDVVAAVKKRSYETCSDALGRAGQDCRLPRACHFTFGSVTVSRTSPLDMTSCIQS